MKEVGMVGNRRVIVRYEEAPGIDNNLAYEMLRLLAGKRTVAEYCNEVIDRATKLTEQRAQG